MSSLASQQAYLDSIIAKGKSGKINNPATYTSNGVYDAATHIKEKALYQAYTTAMTQISARFSPLLNVSAKIAELTIKKNTASKDKPFTAQDSKDLEDAQKIVADMDSSISSLISVSADEAQQLRKTLIEERFKATTPPGKANEVSTSKPDNLADYVIKTQALNPYGRERECDIRFLSVIELTGTQSKQITKDSLELLKKYIKDHVISAAS